jgi:DNA-binding transcriptional MerR regulator/methylmalonyl-CoA mutase cobalamin-binding subunit
MGFSKLILKTHLILTKIRHFIILNMANNYKYPIKVVSQMTGLSVHVIRAWEKRYNVVEPDRTDTNRRLYSEEDIEKLKLLNDVVHNGHNISGIAKLSNEELHTVLKDKKSSQDSMIISKDAVVNGEFNFHLLINSAIEAIKAYDNETLETLLLKAASQVSQPHLIENLIVPLVYKIGDLWHEGELRVANEHMASAVIRNFLVNQIENYNTAENAPVVICATPRGQEHELGALIAGLIAASSGWRVIYLGSNLPIEELGAVVSSVDIKAIALSIIYPADDPRLSKDLIHLKKILPENVSIIVGGRAAKGYAEALEKIRAIVVGDTKSLRLELEAIREHKYN